MDSKEDTLVKLLQDLKSSEFYGTLTICIRKGNIYMVRKEETLKLSEENS